MSKRLQEILKKNAEQERESPYNFCDRWCERCDDKKQKQCKLYQDEFEQKITCIAYGRQANDLEVLSEVMKMQYEGLDEKLEEHLEELDIDFNEIDDPEFEKIKNHIKFMEDNPLQATADQYMKRACKFLGQVFPENKSNDLKLPNDFEIVAWYHALLPVKLNRALAGFHEPAVKGDLALYDSVAQFQICKKAIKESLKALKNIRQTDNSYKKDILELIVLLHNIHSRIEVLEETIK